MTEPGNSRDSSSAPEQRWRRTVDMRGQSKLKVGRLLRDFGFEEFDAEAIESIEGRLVRVGLAVEPRLRDVEADSVVTLVSHGDGALAADSAAATAGAAPPAAMAPAAVPEHPPAVPGNSAVRAENRRLLDERSEAERRLEARMIELRDARSVLLTQREVLAATRTEVQRTAAELHLALTEGRLRDADPLAGESPVPPEAGPEDGSDATERPTQD